MVRLAANYQKLWRNTLMLSLAGMLSRYYRLLMGLVIGRIQMGRRVHHSR